MSSGRKWVEPVAVIGAVVLVLGLAGWLGWSLLAGPQRGENPTAALGQGEYHLVTTDGTTFTRDTLKGAPSAVFFGFTHCPEVCPTTLGDVSEWQEDLAQDGRQLRVFFVTVDPERDTPEMLRDYVSWVPGVAGVSGSREEIDKAIAAFKVFAKKVPLEDGGYTMDHSALVLLFDADGDYQSMIQYQEEYDSAMRKLRDLLAG